MSNSVILLIKTVILRLKMSKLSNLQKVKTVVRQCQNGHFKTATVKTGNSVCQNYHSEVKTIGIKKKKSVKFT